MDRDCLIELRNVSFAYPRSDSPVVEDVNLKIYRGECVGIIGGNRSGKSTLLHIMSGVIPHYLSGTLEGEVYVAGEPTRNLSLAQIAARVGVVLQDPDSQLFNMYVRQELLWGLENRGLPREEMERRLEEALPFFGLQNLLNQFCAGISGGQKQKVAIAAVYLTQPDMMLLDNPTSMLDPVSTRVVLETVAKLVQRHQTIVVVEENIFELLTQVNRLILMDRGRIVVDAPPREYQYHVSKLREAGVYVPQIWELSHQMGQRTEVMDAFPLSVDEAETVYSRWLKEARSRA